MAVPPADPSGPQPPQPRQPAQPGQLRPSAPGWSPARSPGSSSPIDQALLSGVRHPAGPKIESDSGRPATGGGRPAPKPAPQPHPRPASDARAEARTPRPRPTTPGPGPKTADPADHAGRANQAGRAARADQADHAGRANGADQAEAGRADRAGRAGPEAVNPIDLPGHGLRFRPVVHVEDMAASVEFYERLGAEIVHGGPDGDWVLIQLGTTQVDLITRPPRAERGECTVELNFAAEEPLELLRDRLRGTSGGTGDGRGADDPGAELATHPDLGELLEVRTPDGLLIKISQLDPDL